MKNRNAIFLEEHNFTFSNRKNLNNMLILMFVFVLFAYMDGPLNGSIYYLKNNTAPHSGTFTAIAGLFILLGIILRKVILSLEDQTLTPLTDWIKRSPLGAARITWSYIIFFTWYSFVLTVMLLPVLIIGYATSGAGFVEIGLCTLYIFLMAFFFQLVSHLLRGFTDNGGAFIALWILVLFNLTLLYSLLKNSNPFFTIDSMFSTNGEAYQDVSFLGRNYPYCIQGFLILLALIVLITGAVSLQTVIKRKNKGFG
jgi:hypothetical protein